jgi:hypothetical protein
MGFNRRRTVFARATRSCFEVFAGSTAMSVLCVARWRGARGMIEWLHTQERLNPEDATILRTAARYRRATVGSSHDDAHPDNLALHTGAVRSHTGFVENFFFILPRMLIWEISPRSAPYGPSFGSARNSASFFVNFFGMRFSSGE